MSDKESSTSDRSIPMSDRLLGYAEAFVTSFKPAMMNDGGVGSLKTAFNRSSRYNDKKTRVTAPVSASSKS